MKQYGWVFAMVIGISAVAFGAEGLFTDYVDVTCRSIPPGRDALLQDGGQTLTLTNANNFAIVVDVQAHAPSPTQLKEGALPIPDAGWIRFDPATLRIPPHSKATSRIWIRVPEKRAYRKRWFQVMIWSHAHPDIPADVRVGAGLLSRVRFFVDPKAR